MPPVLKLTDKPDLEPTSKYPYGKFSFPSFNCIQSRLLEVYNQDTNGVIASSTSSGKTTMAEMFMAYCVRVLKKKALFLAPLRALAQEKYDDWTSKDHHFSDLNVSICTGDYRLTTSRLKELNESNIVVMSSELLNHRVRIHKSEHSKFILDAGILVADEAHLISVPGRGSHLEAGLMKFTEINPNARILLLSATMPNVDEIADWVSYSLTRQNTFLLKSTYRPCPLNFHYEKYWDGEKLYESNELQKVNLATQIVEYYPDDKFLIFAHTKRTGEMMKKALHTIGVKCEFHNADLDKTKRNNIEKQFKEDKTFRCIIATSTLAYGINTAARRVIILGVHRGLDEVPVYDIIQMAGRSGRPGFDPVGDAYILIPEHTFDMHKERIRRPQKIESQMLDNIGGRHKVLAFHLVSEIYQGTIQDKDDVSNWYKRSLACFQSNELEDAVIDSTLDILKKCGAIWEENGKFTVTSVGKIASLFYYSPFDVSDLKRNFGLLFDNNKEDDDYWLSMALGNVDTQRLGIVSKVEREDMSKYATDIGNIFGRGTMFEPAIKAGYAYYLLLNGRSNNHFAAMTRNLLFDFPRLNQVLYALDGFTGKWNKKGWFSQLELRLKYGVKGPMVVLCQIPQVGKARATKLWDAGLKSVEDVANNPTKVLSLGFTKNIAEEIIDGAKLLLLTS